MNTKTNFLLTSDGLGFSGLVSIVTSIVSSYLEKEVEEFS